MDETDTDTTTSADEAILESENERINRWRAQELERAGYSTTVAFELALRHDVDLHDAVDLLRRGCPPELAARILL